MSAPYRASTIIGFRSAAIMLGLVLAVGCSRTITDAPANKAGEPTEEQLAKARAELPQPKPPLSAQLKIDAAMLLQRGVDETAADALGRIGAAAIPALEAALRDTDPLVRREAARAFARMGTAAEPALPALIAALKDPDENVRRAVAQAIGQIGPAAETAIPALVEALRDHPQEPASP